MAIEHLHEDHGHEADPVVRGGWMPGVAQIVSLAAGILYVVLGAVALARGDLHHVSRNAVSVGPFSMTPLLGFVMLGIGVVGLAAAVDRMSARGIGMVFGPGLIALGVIALIQSVSSLGWNQADGVLYVVTGAVMLLGAIMTTPLFARTITEI